MLEDVILIFLRDLKTNLCRHNQNEVESVHYTEVSAKEVLKNCFVSAETSDTNSIYQLCSKPLTHQRDLDLKYTQDILLLHTAKFLYHFTQCLRPQHFELEVLAKMYA